MTLERFLTATLVVFTTSLTVWVLWEIARELAQ